MATTDAVNMRIVPELSVTAQMTVIIYRETSSMTPTRASTCFTFFMGNSFNTFQSIYFSIVVEFTGKSKQILKKVLENRENFAIIIFVPKAHDKNVQRWDKHGIITGVAEGCLQ